MTKVEDKPFLIVGDRKVFSGYHLLLITAEYYRSTFSFFSFLIQLHNFLSF